MVDFNYQRIHLVSVLKTTRSTQNHQRNYVFSSTDLTPSSSFVLRPHRSQRSLGSQFFGPGFQLDEPMNYTLED